MAAAMLAVFGGLRLSRTAAAFSTAVAIATYVPFAVSSAGYVEVSVIAAGAVILFGIGVLDWWIIDVVRRAAAGDLARASLKRFLPSHLISGAYSNPAALIEPRTGDATVLFTDLRGFTAMSESLTPAEVLALLNELHGELVKIVRKHGGVIDKFTGDGMLAVFGALRAETDHADRALAVARGLREAMVQLNRARAGREQPPLHIGIGLHSGPIVAGCVGSEDRLEFTVIGDTVNTAARVEALTKDHGVDVLVTSETWSRLSRREGLVDCGEAQLRGRKKPLRVFSLPA
jgi:class 3 adenylate cyclase